MVTEEQAAVIAGVPQAAFTDNVQYQFRTENNGGQVRCPSFPAWFWFPSYIVVFSTSLSFFGESGSLKVFRFVCVWGHREIENVCKSA